VLKWIGEQYLARTDVVAVLLARLSPVEDLDRGRPVGEWTLRHHAARWERLRFIQRQRLLGRTWFLPTRRGLTFAGIDFPTYAPVGQRLAHQHATAVVRLAVEAAYPDAKWVSERELRGGRGTAAGWWLPDGMVDATTVEVEISPKKKADLAEAATTKQHPAAHNRVYFAPANRVDTLRTRLAAIAAEVERSGGGWPWLPTEVRELPGVVGVSYDGAR
jgi:hypothetical protein